MMIHRFDPFLEARNRSSTWRYFLAADTYRVEDTFYLEVDVPGVKLEDIDIEVEKKHLTVTVERHQLVDDDRTDIVRGRPTGRFVRRFFLGDGLDGEGVEASYENGVLTLSIPVNEASKAHKVAITASSTTGS
ncbi:MAG: Hsp20/alpha crystallin family protein [Acidobacteria bacterium]|nr:Hsp20/alpha crystallin family protein [Acidobacteriota bacterium]MCZ6505806.1 Hsp20/alpha crystallin family protein [Actinomycetota bacterium]MCZ6739391.1 Hsp20/alpha crystallin family protein [Actinomycetota bacterium]TDI48580.1 MAG: Hsp20/alpha crystallin family protein [Acidobacteriota bacterium]